MRVGRAGDQNRVDVRAAQKGVNIAHLGAKCVCQRGCGIGICIANSLQGRARMRRDCLRMDTSDTPRTDQANPEHAPPESG